MVKRKARRVARKKVSARLKKAVRRAIPKRRVSRIKRIKATQTRRKQKAPSRRVAPAKRMQKQVSLPKPALSVSEQEIGYISHYFTNINVGIIELTKGNLNRGDKIRIKGETTDFTQVIDSMQYEHQPVDRAEAGKSIGIKVSDRVREHDKVYKVE